MLIQGAHMTHVNKIIFSQATEKDYLFLPKYSQSTLYKIFTKVLLSEIIFHIHPNFSTKKIPLFLFNCMLIKCNEKVTHEKNETTEILIKHDN